MRSRTAFLLAFITCWTWRIGLTTIRRKFVFFREKCSSNSAAVCLSALAEAPLQLPRIQLDDQLLVDHRLDLFPGRNTRYFAFEGIAIDRQPIGNRNDLC